MPMPFYQMQHKQDIIRHFTPNWFAITMGTGVVALILPEFSFFSCFDVAACNMVVAIK